VRAGAAVRRGARTRQARGGLRAPARAMRTIRGHSRLRGFRRGRSQRPRVGLQPVRDADHSLTAAHRRCRPHTRHSTGRGHLAAAMCGRRQHLYQEVQQRVSAPRALGLLHAPRGGHAAPAADGGPRSGECPTGIHDDASRALGLLHAPRGGHAAPAADGGPRS
ncbi:hypothetical protein evm_015364, partial [Chilo suppressalis]